MIRPIQLKVNHHILKEIKKRATYIASIKTCFNYYMHEIHSLIE